MRGKSGVYKKRKGVKMPKKKVTVTPSLRRAVNSIIAVRAEDKKAVYSLPFSVGQQWSSISYPINAFATDQSSFMPVLPSITQGLTSANRIGSRVSVKSCYIDIFVSINGVQTQSLDAMLRILLVTDKSVGSYYEAQAVPSPIHYSELLDLGGGVSTQFLGSPNDLLLDVNRNQFTVHYDKCVHLQKAVGLNNDGGLPYPSRFGTVASQNSNTLFRARIKVPLPKVLKYNLDTDGSPSHVAPLLSIGYAHVDNTLPSTDLLLGYNAICTLKYEDS